MSGLGHERTMAAVYSITSSTRSKNGSGTGSPRARAVVRLRIKFELCRLFDRHVSWLCPAQDPIHIVTRPMKKVHIARAIGHESSRLDEITSAVDHRQSVAERESENPIEIGNDQLVDHNVERIRLRVSFSNVAAMSCCS
jgi:hypothetical protein